jgi:hypothetical protein
VPQKRLTPRCVVSVPRYAPSLINHDQYRRVFNGNDFELIIRFFGHLFARPYFIEYIDDLFAPYRLNVELFFCAEQVALTEAIFFLEQMQLGIRRVCYHRLLRHSNALSY